MTTSLGEVLGRGTAFLWLISAGAAAADCLDQPGPRKIDMGEYHIMRPAGVVGDVPVVMFLHGYGGNGAGVYKNTGIVNAIMARGMR